MVCLDLLSELFYINTCFDEIYTLFTHLPLHRTFVLFACAIYLQIFFFHFLLGFLNHWIIA